MKKALEEDSIAELKAKLRGPVIEQDDPDYDDARKVYNAMIDKKPRLIARCADVADVISSVNFARKHGLLLAIRSGGHNGGGLGICDDGLVIDLGLIKYTRVDPAARTVIVGGGCTWGDVDHATHAFGLATPSGIISTTGVGGLTLGGGIGHLTRKCGLTIDNLISADVVLADGSFVKANANENADLFKPIRAFKKAALDFVGPLPQPALQSMFDAIYPPGLQWYWRADFVRKLSDEAIAEHIKFANALPSMHSTMHLYPINGAAGRVGKNETAWNYRDATWAQVMVGVDPDPANNDKTISWTKSYWDALHPYSAGGAYVNFMMDEGEERVKATYGDNYQRLVEIKNKYDPDNLFRVNQNIKPNKGKSAPAASS